MGSVRDITGNRYGRYTVVELSHIKNHISYWKCKCDCGNVRIVNSRALKRGTTISCGCYRIEKLKAACTKHGEKGTRLYREWVSMRNRCICKSNTSYPRYGGRGIKVCDEWSEYLPFKKWAMDNGYHDDLTLDRINPNGNYTPENCRWATVSEQNVNKRNTLYVDFNGERKPLLRWCNDLGLNYRLMHQRIKRLNWSAERAFTTPVGE